MPEVTPHAHATLPEAPRAMKSPVFGLYHGAVREGPDAPPMRAAAMRRKRWVYVGVCDPSFVLGVAVVDLGFASNAFAYLGGDGARRPREWKSVATPLAATVGRRSAAFSGGGGRLWLALPEGSRPGALEGRVPLGGGAWGELALSLKGGAGGEVTCVAPAGVGGDARWNLTTKNNALTAEGALRWGDRVVEVSAPVIVDVTDAYPARRTVWHWASGAGRVEGLGAVGFNLCALHNDSERARENVLWVNGAPRALGRVRFSFDRARADTAEWSIDGERTSLRFRPWGLRDGHEDLGLVESRFVQPYGEFSGEVDGVRVDGVTGVVEDHEAVW